MLHVNVNTVTHTQLLFTWPSFLEFLNVGLGASGRVYPTANAIPVSEPTVSKQLGTPLKEIPLWNNW